MYQVMDYVLLIQNLLIWKTMRLMMHQENHILVHMVQLQPKLLIYQINQQYQLIVYGVLQNNPNDYRVRIVRNKVHHNYNEIYSWAPTKDIITPRIDEGKGISLQRNQDFVNGGRILVGSNIAYWNGFSGIHSNDGNNIDFIGNTSYMNSFTNTVTYASDPKGNNIGISMSNGENNRIINNIANN